MYTDPIRRAWRRLARRGDKRAGPGAGRPVRASRGPRPPAPASEWDQWEVPPPPRGDGPGLAGTLVVMGSLALCLGLREAARSEGDGRPSHPPPVAHAAAGDASPDEPHLSPPRPAH